MDNIQLGNGISGVMVMRNVWYNL